MGVFLANLQIPYLVVSKNDFFVIYLIHRPQRHGIYLQFAPMLARFLSPRPLIYQ
jgi:hypothetical protein